MGLFVAMFFELDFGPFLPIFVFCGPDVTDWFLLEIKNLAAAAQRADLRKAWDPVLIWEVGGSIQHKKKAFAPPGASPCGLVPPCKGTVTLCGKCLDRSELGNILAGVAARKVGMGKTAYSGEVNFGAWLKGTVEGKKIDGPDTPQDWASIDIAYAIAMPITKKSLCGEISKNKDIAKGANPTCIPCFVKFTGKNSTITTNPFKMSVPLN